MWYDFGPTPHVFVAFHFCAVVVTFSGNLYRQNPQTEWGKVTAKVSLTGRDSSKTLPRKQHPSLWLRARQGQLFADSDYLNDYTVIVWSVARSSLQAWGCILFLFDCVLKIFFMLMMVNKEIHYSETIKSGNACSESCTLSGSSGSAEVSLDLFFYWNANWTLSPRKALAHLPALIFQSFSVCCSCVCSYLCT